MSEKMTLTPEIYEAFREYSERYYAWGALHVVLEDMNLDDYFVRGCMDFAKELGDADGMQLAFTLLQLSRTQRGRIAKRIPANYDAPHVSEALDG